ncbi:MAG: hypothetical protein Salg2KO_18840 [Salibacteraceae bacterium]
MTEKKERIIESALKLFATEGYASTSTSKVAKHAGVSEGLIFRHFKNKEGLLQAVMEQSRESARHMMADVIMTSEPSALIQKFIELPFTIDEDHYEMWRLTYALKWQMDAYDDSFYQPLKLALNHAFRQLGYSDPNAEVELLLMFMDGAATSILLHPPKDKMEIRKALKNKYNL